MAQAIGTDLFVGREREMAELSAALDSALDGRGGLVMLVGEPGIGKTRLSEELESVARGRGAEVVRGACYEGGSTPPYWPWTQVIRSLLTEPSEATITALDARAAAIAEIVPEIDSMMPDLTPPPEVEPEQARFRLFESVTAFLNEIAISQPMIVVFDDLHWADRSTLDLLEFVAREVSSSPILMIGSYRDTELSRQHPLSETLATLARARGFQRIPVRGLASDDVGRLVEAIGGIKPSLALIEEIHSRTEGNPFFVAEVTRDLAREARTGDGNFDSAGGFRVPDGVREAIGIRLNNLSEECNQALRIAAIIGREFELELMKQLLPLLSEKRFLAVLEEALSASIVEEIPGTAGRCRFTHALIQETLTQEFSAARRAGLHAEIGEALEVFYANDVEAHADELAYHFAGAGPVPGGRKLVHYSLLAGKRALAAYAWEEALHQFQRGLAAKEGQVIDADMAALLFGLARAQSNTLERHRVYEAVSTARPAFDYYVEVDDVPAALVIAGYPFFSESDPGVTSLLAEALKLVPPDSHHAGRLLVRYGIALASAGEESGNFESVTEALGQALVIARRENDTALEVTALKHLAYAHLMIRFDPQESIKYSLKSIELDHLDTPMPNFFAHWCAAVALVTMGDLKGARPHAEASLALAEKRTGRFNIGQVLMVNEAIAHLQGNWEAARDFSDRGLTADRQDSRLVSNRSTLEYELGDFDEGDAYVDRLIETMRLTPPAPTLESSITTLAIGMANRLTGVARHIDIGEEAADTVLSSLSPSQNFYVQLTRTGLALIAVERGDVELARKQYEVLKSRHMELSGVNLICADRVLGLLAQTLGRMDDAVAHFEDSLAFCRKADIGPELAWTCNDFAGALLQRDGPGDHFRAVSLAERALAISTELGMRPLMERSAALQEKLRLVPAGAPDYPAGLTAREVEVLRLVASGKSNAAIAEDLVLSIRTVERHISNIYGKTGSGGRAGATAFAFTNGLIPTP